MSGSSHETAEEDPDEAQTTSRLEQPADGTDQATMPEGVAETILGRAGRLISMSKSGYHRARPDHLVVFNAGALTADGTEIWWGDLDLTLDESKIGDLARTLGEQVYVLHEPFRRYFEQESTESAAFTATIREVAVLVAEADGNVSVVAAWAWRDDSGTLRLVNPWPTHAVDSPQSQEPEA
jgi:hypothetical protein